MTRLLQQHRHNQMSKSTETTAEKYTANKDAQAQKKITRFNRKTFVPQQQTSRGTRLRQVCLAVLGAP